jgi:lysozyme
MIASAIDLVRAQEGCRLAAYRDTRGVLTCGFGHTGPDVYEGMTVSQERADTWLYSDMRVATIDAALVIGSQYWNSLNDARRAALISMALNLGRERLAGFRKMIAAIRRGDWDAAAREALDSEWARQVPGRAKVDAGMIASGGWPFDVAA